MMGDEKSINENFDEKNHQNSSQNKKEADSEAKLSGTENSDGKPEKNLKVQLEKNKKTILTLFLIFLLLCALGVWVYNKYKSDPDILTLYGNVDIRDVNLGFRVSGRLDKMYFEEGDVVKKGDLLAQLDDQTYKEALDRLIADRKSAEIVYSNALKNYNRYISLCVSKTVSQEECDSIATAKNDYSAKLDSLKAQEAEARTNFVDTQIFAPNNGIILTRIQEPGAILGTNSPVYTLSLTDKTWVRAYVDETNLGKIKLGMKVNITIDAFPDKEYIGQIGFISTVAEFTPKNVETTNLRTDLVYRLRIVVNNPDLSLKQNMPVSVKINLKDQTYEHNYSADEFDEEIQ